MSAGQRLLVAVPKLKSVARTDPGDDYGMSGGQRRRFSRGQGRARATGDPPRPADVAAAPAVAGAAGWTTRSDITPRGGQGPDASRRGALLQPAAAVHAALKSPALFDVQRTAARAPPPPPLRQRRPRTSRRWTARRPPHESRDRSRPQKNCCTHCSARASAAPVVVWQGRGHKPARPKDLRLLPSAD